jgi:SAM-dependent methyltransferase
MQKMTHEIWEKYLSYNENLPIEKTAGNLKPIIDMHLSYINCAGKFLDLGMGDGYVLDKMRGRGFILEDLYGASINKKEVNFVRNKGHQGFHEDMHNLSFKNNFFDIVYTRQTLEHSIAPYIVISEIYRVLKNCGKLVLIVPPTIDITNSNSKFIYMHNSAPKHYSVLTEDQWFTLWNKFGFILRDMWTLMTPHGIDKGYLLEKPKNGAK